MSLAGLHHLRSSLCLHLLASSTSFLFLGNAKLIPPSEPLCFSLTLPQFFFSQSSPGWSRQHSDLISDVTPLKEAFPDHSGERSLQSLSILLLCVIVFKAILKLFYLPVHLCIVCLFLLNCSLCLGLWFVCLWTTICLGPTIMPGAW